MRTITRGLAKLVGTLLMIAAFIQWWTFDYPDVNPFWPGAMFAPGMFSQAVNWLVVCLLATAGWGVFTLGKFKLERRTGNSQTSSDKL